MSDAKKPAIVPTGGWEDSMRRQHVSLGIILIAAITSAVNTHGYTVISAVLWMLNIGLLFYIRYASKTESSPNHNSWFAILGSVALTLLPMFPPNDLMFIIGLVYLVLLVSLRTISKAEVRFATLAEK